MRKATILFLIDLQNGFVRNNLTPEQGGSLYVPGAELIVRPAADLIRQLRGATVVMTQDYHPADHISFVENHPGANPYFQLGLKLGKSGRYVAAHPGDVIDFFQTLWPTHCVRGTESAQIAAPLLREIPEPLRSVLEHDEALISAMDDRGNTFHVVRKGTRSDLDSYGIVTENDNKSHTNAEHLFSSLANDLDERDVEIANIFIGGVATNYCVEFSNRDIHRYLVPQLRAREIDSTVTFVRDLSVGIRASVPQGEWPDLAGTVRRFEKEKTRFGTSIDVLFAQAPDHRLSGHPPYPCPEG